MVPSAASPDEIVTPLQQVSLSRLIHTAGLIALTVAGPIVFIPAIIAVLSSDVAPLASALLLALPALLWLAGFTPALAPHRAWVQAAAPLTMLLLGLLLPAEVALPSTIIGFAAIVGAVFTLPVRGAAGVIIAAALLDLVYALTVPSPAASSSDVGAAAILSGPLLQLLAGGGLLLAWQSWLSRISDAEVEYELVERAAEQSTRDQARLAASEAVTRRIHETVLNTLTAVSMGVAPEQEAAARQACRRDLEQAGMGTDLLSDARLSRVIEAASVAVPRICVRTELPAPFDVTVPASIANPLRDALVEALRNIERHSGVLEALIRVTLDDRIRMEVSDAGIGVATDAEERFGMRNSLRIGMASIGGHAQISGRDGGGTVVELSAPREMPATDRPLGLRTLRVVDSSTWARIGVMGTNVFMLILVVPVASAFREPSLTGGLIVAYIAALALLALLWQRIPRRLVTATAMVLLVAVYLSTIGSQLTCSSMWAVATLLAGMAGGAVLLPLLALDTWRTRALAVTVTAAASVIVVAQVPASCRLDGSIEWGATTAYMAAFALGMTWVETVFQRQRDRAQSRWNSIVARQVEDERRRAAAATWGVLTDASRDLLEGVADGTLSTSAPDISARAAVEADALRARLGLSPELGDAVGHLARRLVRTAARHGSTVEVELLMEFRRADPYPDAVIEVLESILSGDPGSHLVLRGFIDEGYEELVAVIPNGVSALPAQQDVGDTTVHAFVGDTETHLLVRRPGAVSS